MNAAATVCQEIYEETRAFYESHIHRDCDLGFKILYGPPTPRPPILFIGHQPGGDWEDHQRELKERAHDRWPEKCEYAEKPWALARTMRRMFGIELLQQCTGLNAIFFRSPRQKEYVENFAPALRREIETFCRPRVFRMIRAIQPRQIVVIGFGTLELYSIGVAGITTGTRVLTRTGTIDVHSVEATLHLSGARISSADRARIRDRILDLACIN